MRFPAGSTPIFTAMYIVEERLESNPIEVSFAWSCPTYSEALAVFVEQGSLYEDRMYQIYYSIEIDAKLPNSSERV